MTVFIIMSKFKLYYRPIYVGLMQMNGAHYITCMGLRNDIRLLARNLPFNRN